MATVSGEIPAAAPMRVAYLVSRYPANSEVFVVRELNALAATAGVEAELWSLFVAPDSEPHASGREWLTGLRRPGGRDAIAALGWWLLRRPLRLLLLIGSTIAWSARSPGLMVRSLTTVALAASHARHARAAGIDHVHAHFANHPAAAAWAIGRLTGIPYSFTAHAHDIFLSQRGLRRKLTEAAFVATISEFNVRFITAHVGSRTRTPIEIVHCGIHPERYPYRPRAVPGDGPVRALCVATLQEKKGHRFLFEALAGHAPLERIELDLVGGGSLRDELESLARQLGLADRVRFHGPLDEADVRRLLERADLFVLPSVIAADGQMEGIPVALMEAVATGLWVVATRISGIPELVEEGATGELAAERDPASLRAALERSIAHPEPPQRSGRELIEREFDVERSAARIVALIRAGQTAEQSPPG